QHLLGQGEAGGLGVAATCTDVSAEALARGDHEAVLTEALARAQPVTDGPMAAAVARPPRADEAAPATGPARGSCSRWTWRWSRPCPRTCRRWRRAGGDCP